MTLFNGKGSPRQAFPPEVLVNLDNDETSIGNTPNWCLLFTRVHKNFSTSHKYTHGAGECYLRSHNMPINKMG